MDGLFSSKLRCWRLAAFVPALLATFGCQQVSTPRGSLPEHSAATPGAGNALSTERRRELSKLPPISSSGGASPRKLSPSSATDGKIRQVAYEEPLPALSAIDVQSSKRSVQPNTDGAGRGAGFVESATPTFQTTGFEGFTGMGGPYPAPRELAKVILPDYRIEPPDILQIDAIHISPKAPYRLRSLDSVVVSVPGALPDAPIDGIYAIEPGGTVNFGRPYPRVSIGGKTIDEAKAAIEQALGKEQLKDATCTVNLGEIGAKQQISGPHLVGPDGAITLGSYGKVVVVGMTVAQAQAAVQNHLARSLDEPEISIDVFAYNSKTYYVILQGAGLGDGVNRFPITGNDTVLDAISLIQGLSPTSSTKIWVARPGFNSRGCHQLLPVDWYAITQCADATTNYQLLPGDRVYVAEDRLIALDTMLGKIISPAERILGFVALGTSTVSDLRFFHIPQGRSGF